MNILKYIILTLTVLNLPSVFFFHVDPTLSSLMSYGSYALLILFYVLSKGGKPNIWLLVLGLAYFLIAGVNFYSGLERDFYVFLIKYIIIIVGGSALVKKTTVNELFVFLVIGSISIIAHAVFFPDRFGRYSGFYINPNMAGFIAIMAYTLTFKIKNFYSKSLAQIIITIGGIVTFSRTFILIWVITNLLSISISIKNLRILAIGLGLLVSLTIFGPMLKLNTERLNQFTAILNKEEGALKSANKESRTETWAVFYDYVIEKPFFGNGYGAFQTNGLNHVGAHNSFLLVLGESGIIPFLIFIGLCLYFIFMGAQLFRHTPYLLMQGIAFSLFILTCHNFFDTDYLLIIALWMYNKINVEKEAQKQMLLES
ncbi:O-antigen ligase family protein [Spongiimicrobium sp. 3-5]|uniref:O-antigen ligase family protein n=1 Tax=Spongiimicrobium sp. 3-5 TaxID=3332596 RepID=UPI00397F8830